MPKRIITQKRLKELLKYNPKTGIFTWVVNPKNHSIIDRVAGCVNGCGYIQIQVLSKQYLAHRLAFLYMTGKIPKQVDHGDHDKSNNRWKNLNAASAKINGRNMPLRVRNTSGFNGVRWVEDRCKWRAYLDIGDKFISLGYYTNKLNAIAARKAANIKYKFHKNHGK